MRTRDGGHRRHARPADSTSATCRAPRRARRSWTARRLDADVAVASRPRRRWSSCWCSCPQSGREHRPRAGDGRLPPPTTLPVVEDLGDRLRATIPVENTADSIAVTDDAVWVSGGTASCVADRRRHQRGHHRRCRFAGTRVSLVRLACGSVSTAAGCCGSIRDRAGHRHDRHRRWSAPPRRPAKSGVGHDLTSRRR